MERRDELAAVRWRLELVEAHLDGKSPSEIARDYETSAPTVRKWIKRYASHGVQGLLSGRSTGRPKAVGPAVREALVRLPKETRPPFEIGDQWTVRTLGEVFQVSPAYVSLTWKDAGYDPPLHLQQVMRNPDRRVTMRVDVSVPAWLRLHWELSRREAEDADSEDWGDMRKEVLPTLENRWTDANERLPRVDPRRPDYFDEDEDEG